MSWILIVEQSLNGLQFGLMLFLLAAGLTLVFGIMDMINLAHGSLYMLGAFLAATLVHATGSFALGVLLAIPATAVLGMLLEMSVLRTLYARDHLSQVLATFALILIFNEAVRIIWGPDMPLSVPAALSGPVQLLPGMVYPAYRLLIIGVGAAGAALRGAGRHGREHPHSRLRRHRHRRHRIDPRRPGGFAARRGRGHDRARFSADAVRNILPAAGRERRRAGDRFGARLPADGRGPVHQAAGAVPCARVGRCAARRRGSLSRSLSPFRWRCRRSTRPTT